MSYYNTTHLTGFELKESRRKANTQEDRILTFFEKNADKAFSPEDIQIYCMMANRPLTSVRRAITNLTNNGYLRKTNDMKPGIYGKPVHTWEFSHGQNQKELW
jgi:hypothetical protein